MIAGCNVGDEDNCGIIMAHFVASHWHCFPHLEKTKQRSLWSGEVDFTRQMDHMAAMISQKCILKMYLILSMPHPLECIIFKAWLTEPISLDQTNFQLSSPQTSQETLHWTMLPLPAGRQQRENYSSAKFLSMLHSCPFSPGLNYKIHHRMCESNVTGLLTEFTQFMSLISWMLSA